MNVTGIKESATEKTVKILVQRQPYKHKGVEISNYEKLYSRKDIKRSVISSQLYKSRRVLPKYYNERLAEKVRKKAST